MHGSFGKRKSAEDGGPTNKGLKLKLLDSLDAFNEEANNAPQQDDDEDEVFLLSLKSLLKSLNVDKCDYAKLQLHQLLYNIKYSQAPQMPHMPLPTHAMQPQVNQVNMTQVDQVNMPPPQQHYQQQHSYTRDLEFTYQTM